MALDDLLDDGQTRTATTAVFIWRMQPLKDGKDRLLQRGRNTDAVVFDIEHGFRSHAIAAVLLVANLNPFIWPVVIFGRVEDEVIEDFADPDLIASDAWQGSWQTDFDRLHFEKRRQSTEHVGDTFV